MTRPSLAAVLVLFAATGSAFAADEFPVDPTPFVSTRTRAEVRAELEQFRQSQGNPWADSYDPLPAFRSAKTRAQVTSEFLAARAEVAASHGEDGGAAWRAAHAPRATNPVLAGTPVNAQ